MFPNGVIVAGGGNLAETLHHLALPEFSVRCFPTDLEHSWPQHIQIGTGRCRSVVGAALRSLYTTMGFHFQGGFLASQIALLTWAAQRDRNEAVNPS